MYQSRSVICPWVSVCLCALVCASLELLVNGSPPKLLDVATGNFAGD